MLVRDNLNRGTIDRVRVSTGEGSEDHRHEGENNHRYDKENDHGERSIYERSVRFRQCEGQGTVVVVVEGPPLRRTFSLPCLAGIIVVAGIGIVAGNVVEVWSWPQLNRHHRCRRSCGCG